MAKRKVTQQASAQEPDLLVDVQEVRQTAADFWSQYGKMISLVGGGLLLIVGGYFAYKNLFQAPKQKEAMTAMAAPQFLFERDSFQKALDPQADGGPGFLQIMDDFSGTPAGNLAKYYAGICFLQLGQPDNAIEKLKSFSADGEIMPIMKNGALADAYGDKADYASAIDSYKDAIKAGDNDVLTPYYMKKLGQLYEYQNNAAEAKKLYDEVKRKYPNSGSAQDIDKYIIRAGK